MDKLEDMRGKLADTKLRKELTRRVIKGEIVEVLKDLHLMPLDQIKALFYARFYKMDLWGMSHDDEWTFRGTAEELDRFVDTELCIRAAKMAEETISKRAAIEWLTKNPTR
jgi:hypothetical protein